MNRLEIYPSLALGTALAFGAAAPALAERFSIAEDMHTRNEVSFTSTAPLVKFTGRTGRVLGMADIDVSDVTRSRGQFTVDLTTLDTGIKLRDQHMRGFLETETHPHARFKVTKIRSEVRSLPPNKPVNVAVDGDLTIHGVTRRVAVPAELTFLPQTDPEFRKGDWVKVSSAFNVKLTDYGIKIPALILGPKVNNDVTIALEVMVRAEGATDKGSMSNPCAL